MPIVVLATRLPDAGTDLMALDERQVLRSTGSFTMRLPPGRYTVAAAEDANRNAQWDEGERITISDAIEVVATERQEVVLLVQTADVQQRDEVPLALDQKSVARGEVRPLTDPRCGPEDAELGIWEPARYGEEHQPGIYMLQPFDPDRVPVLFIHGMGGYPREFEPLITKLDRDRFQPWVAMYPSGQSLADVVEMLRLATTELEVKLGLTRTCIVGHSMGGLVARALVATHAARTPQHTVRGLVTIASPLGGVRAAQLGVKLAPVVVPSWHDLDPASEFLEQLYGTPLPPDVEYHLLFAYDGRSSSDGVAALESQLRGAAQAEADVVAGYWATHVGVLHSDDVSRQVGAALSRCAGDHSRPRVAPRAVEVELAETPAEASEPRPNNAAFRATISSSG